MALLPRFHLEFNWLGIFWQLSNVTKDASDEPQDAPYGAIGAEVVFTDDIDDELVSEAPEDHTVPIGFGRYPGYLDGEGV